LAIELTNSDQQYSTMGKGKTGQNRKTVISTTAQWPKEKKELNRQIVISTTAQGPMEKKDKMTNSDQQYSTMAKGKKGQNDKQ
jgi:hypothetical protein